MVSPETVTDQADQAHVSALKACTSIADQIRYACEHVVRPTTREVREWLSTHGVDTNRSYASSVVSGWRRHRGLGDTGDLVALTPDMLAELDRVTTERPEHTETTEHTPRQGVTLTVDSTTNTAPNTDTADAVRGVGNGVGVHDDDHNGVGDSVHMTGVNASTPFAPVASAPSVGRVPALLRWASGMAWLVVLAAALGISWWSLLEYAQGFGMPKQLAAVVSLVFDASALIVAGLAHRYAVSPYSGIGPRLTLLALLAGSVYLNWQHAASKGYGTGAAIMFAAPAAVGIVLFELHTGWHSRTERHHRGRIARPLPVLGLWGWVLHPLQSAATMWTVSRARGHAVRTAELHRIQREQDAAVSTA